MMRDDQRMTTNEIESDPTGLKYELNQECTKGPVTPHPLGLTWHDHLISLWGWLVLTVITTIIVYYNLTLLYQFNPGYGRNLEMERAFCAEWDEKVISSVYRWSEETLMCVVVEMEVKR